MNNKHNDLDIIIKTFEAEAPLHDPTTQQASPSFEKLESSKELSKWKDLKVHVEVVLGTTKLNSEKLTALKEGSIVVFEELADEFVDIYMNGRKIGRGKIATIDGQYAIQLVHLLEKAERIHTLHS